MEYYTLLEQVEKLEAFIGILKCCSTLKNADEIVKETFRQIIKNCENYLESACNAEF